MGVPHHNRPKTALTDEDKRRLIYYIQHSDEMSTIQIANKFRVSDSYVRSLRRELELDTQEDYTQDEN